MSFMPIVLIFGEVVESKTAGLKAGDIVVTQGGIIGKITGIKDLEVTVEVQQGVRLKVLRSHVTNKHTPGEPAKADAKAS